MKIKHLIFVLVWALFIACNQKKETLIIISKDYNSRVESWLKNIDPTISTKMFYNLPTDSMDYYMQKADGIVIGGGEDVNPLLYGKPEYDSLCETPDNFRDSIETLLIKYALQNKIPLFGICRGNQIMNVVAGGTLIPDIPTFYPNSTINHRAKNDSSHYIIPEKGSWLEKSITGDTLWVNSRHHQSVDKLAPYFSVAAYSSDSVIESIELKDKSIHPFALGVQWHPEGLDDKESYTIGKLFIDNLKTNAP